VINKIDQVVDSIEEAQDISVTINSPPEATVITSALKNWNLDRLLEKISEYLEMNDSGCGEGPG
jgi:50S ribosomal subunit-associated GTPase HflX